MTTLVVALVLAKWAAQLWLEKLNQSHVLAHAGVVPDALKDSIDPATYSKSVEYTLAKKHVPKMLGWSAGGLFIGSYSLAWIANQAWFSQGLGLKQKLSHRPCSWLVC